MLSTEKVNNMNKNILNIKSLFLALCCIFLASCTNDFEDMNRNPGEPTDEEMQEGYYKLGAFFPQMINYAYPAQENAYQYGENLVGDPYGRYLSISNSGFSSNFSIFNAQASWIDNPFKDAFTKVYGSWNNVNTMTNGKGHLYAWAQILRVTAMQRITDMYGPIPYSDAENGKVETKYDSQEQVYKSMFNDLDRAIDTLTVFIQKNPEYRSMEPFDKVYESDFSKWIKYANSLKLRMAMRIVYADPDLAQKKAEEAVAHPGGLIVNNADNASNAFPQNPVYKVVAAWKDSRACSDIIAYMNGYDDPRTEKYFSKSDFEDGPKYLGLRTGVNLPEKTVTDKYSGVNYKISDRTLWMPASEIAFLRAEGALRGWNMGGTAKDFYETGIKLSFTQWAADNSDKYLNNDTSKPADFVDPNSEFSAKAISTITIKWDEAATFETKLERVITQKWIAMFPLGQEAWSEQRRTGYPHFFPVLVNSSDEPALTTRLASRIPFPPNEKQKNTENYNDAVKLLGGPDKYGTKLWWDKNPNKGW